MNFSTIQTAESLARESMRTFSQGMAYAEESLRNLSENLDTDIATTPFEVVYTEDRIRLKHYCPKKTRGKGLKTPLLIVYALINRETMLDLQPDKSVIRNFLEEGVDVYVLEWGYPMRKDRWLTLEDHIEGYMDHVVDHILKTKRLAKLNLMGICMGGTMGVVYASLHPEKVKNLITTVTPTWFDTEEGLLHLWMKETHVERVVEACGNMPGDVMNLGFLMLNPAKLVVEKYHGLMANLNDKDFLENFIRMEKWIFDSPDVPGETFLEFITAFYRENRLLNGSFTLGGKAVDVTRITMPVLNIYAKYDHLVPPSACDRFTKAVGSADVQDLCLDTGHIGIYVSSKCQRDFVPHIAGWLKERDGAEVRKTKGDKEKATAAA
ncbi:class III poly(R)-hydroxyalkanoic acid synthase subunit PhaC [Desulfoluna butyratoxydans]|uniref:Poly(3-hydroxyalkanoate) polymerase subunit PhaC n=1 Tax=Desulfoluna butyratoxydans TaxID=231438 RepID=A0A4U8YUT9_9BACT|nr:class III poly(R)-hydroxyalkanoic acid synthase subunit PhaC [Desulfoluna butyratoxydans]VFQ45682.1 poly(r)-hydroxyalkanoic acid synthase class iii phac subunit [Desulfoluna butyratoxydans]